MTPDKRRSVLRPRSGDGYLSDALVVVATEGQTEYFYLEHLANSLRNSRLRLRLVPDENNRSAPEQVLARLVADRKMSFWPPQQNDQFWIVCDVDHHRKEKLAQVIQEARNQGVSIAWSNPLFEIYLLYHFLAPADCPGTKDEILVKLKSVCEDYSPKNKTRLPDNMLSQEAMRAAVENSRQSESSFDPNKGYPHGTGSLVHRIVEQFL
jgi:hypothetical protein